MYLKLWKAVFYTLGKSACVTPKSFIFHRIPGKEWPILWPILWPIVWPIFVFLVGGEIVWWDICFTEVCCKVLSVKNAYMSGKTALLLSDVIDADHQNSCLFTNKDIFFNTSMGFNWCPS